MCDLEYFSFDVDKFFGEYEDRKVKLKFLKVKLDTIPLASSASTDGVKVTGGLPSSSVEAKAERREKVEKEIRKIENYFEFCDEILENVDDETRFVITEYFINRRKSRYEVELLAEELYCSRATFYRKVKDARIEVKRYVRDNGWGE